MSQRLIAIVPADEQGIVEKYYWDDDRPGYDKLHVIRIQEIDECLEENQNIQNNLRRPGENFGKSPIHHVARIPLIVIEQWMKRGFNWFQSTDAEKRKWLNKPECAKFRTRKSRM